MRILISFLSVVLVVLLINGCGKTVNKGSIYEEKLSGKRYEVLDIGNEKDLHKSYDYQLRSTVTKDEIKELDKYSDDLECVVIKDELNVLGDKVDYYKVISTDEFLQNFRKIE